MSGRNKAAFFSLFIFSFFSPPGCTGLQALRAAGRAAGDGDRSTGLLPRGIPSIPDAGWGGFPSGAWGSRPRVGHPQPCAGTERRRVFPPRAQGVGRLWAHAPGCGTHPAASDPSPSAGPSVTAREAVTPASLASATPLLLAPRPRGSESSNRSFQSCPGPPFGTQPLRSSHCCSRDSSAAGRHPGRGKRAGCVTGSPCLSLILTVVALISHRAPVNACETVPVTPGCVCRGTELSGARRASRLARRKEQPWGASTHSSEVESQGVLRGSPGRVLGPEQPLRAPGGWASACGTAHPAWQSRWSLLGEDTGCWPAPHAARRRWGMAKVGNFSVVWKLGILEGELDEPWGQWSKCSSHETPDPGISPAPSEAHPRHRCDASPCVFTSAAPLPRSPL